MLGGDSYKAVQRSLRCPYLTVIEELGRATGNNLIGLIVDDQATADPL